MSGEAGNTKSAAGILASRLASANSGAVTRVGICAALLLIYFVAGKLGLRLATIDPSATAVWAPAGISLAACLLFGSWVSPAIFLGAFLVNVTTAGSVATSLGIGIGNTIEAVTAAYLVSRFAGGLTVFDRTVDTLKFLLLAAGLSTMLAATIGVTSLCLGGYAQWPDYGRIWLTWWLGDAAGDLIIAPLLILWSLNYRFDWTRQQVIEAVLLLCALAIGGGAMFTVWSPSSAQTYPLEFLGLPLLFWAAFRFGRREAATALFILLAIAIAGTLHGSGPFSRGERNEDLLFLQTFAGLTALMVIVVATEVAQRRILDERHANIAAIVESSNDAIVGSDLDGVVTSWNASASRIFGYSASEAIGRSISIIVPPERTAEEAEMLSRVRLGEAIRSLETIRCRKDGGRVDVSLTVSPVSNHDGQVIGTSKIARDVSEQKRARLEKEKLLRSEQAAREAAEAAGRAKDEFLALLGHELRNPINAISLALRLLDKATSGDDHAKATKIIARQTEHVSKMVDDLLDVARVTTGRIVLLSRPMNFAVTVSECVDALRQTSPLAGHHVSMDLEPVWVRGDPDRLAQVVTNLVNNAAKYTPSGGAIRVTLRAESNHAVLRIEDNGVGIAPEVLPHIFEIFTRGDVGLERSPGGLGIGLALVKRLTELHAGEVAAMSDGEGKGSMFILRLPQIAAPEVSTLQPELAFANKAVSRRILIVEDNPDSRDGLRAWLELSGHEIHEAADGTTAVEMALTLRPDLMLVDIGLPGFNGYEVASRIRSSEIGGITTIIAVSGYGESQHQVRARRAGFDDYIVKPVDPDRLNQLIASLSTISSGQAKNL